MTIESVAAEVRNMAKVHPPEADLRPFGRVDAWDWLYDFAKSPTTEPEVLSYMARHLDVHHQFECRLLCMLANNPGLPRDDFDFLVDLALHVNASDLHRAVFSNPRICKELFCSLVCSSLRLSIHLSLCENPLLNDFQIRNFYLNDPEYHLIILSHQRALPDDIISHIIEKLPSNAYERTGRHILPFNIARQLLLWRKDLPEHLLKKLIDGQEDRMIQVDYDLIIKHPSMTFDLAIHFLKRVQKAGMFEFVFDVFKKNSTLDPVLLENIEAFISLEDSHVDD